MTSVASIGASGCVPEAWGDPVSADELERRAPEYRVGRGESDGQFWLVGGVVCSVFTEESLYSVD